MRKLFILCIGIFFAQQAAATSQCSFKAEADIHCDNCITLHDFALFGAAALSGNYGYFSDAISPTGKTIRVTGNNGSNVVVTKRPAWDPGSLNITAGKYGERGINFNYPSPFEAQVEASDLNNIATGKRGYSERIPYPVLNAKCKQIEKKEKAKEKEEQSKDASSGSGSLILPIDMHLRMQAALRDMIRREGFKGWHYRGGVFGPAEFLRPCDGYSDGDDYVSRCYQG